MAIDKDFVIRNGIEVNEDLIYADPTLSRVGVGTTLPSTKFDVNGDIHSTDSITSETLISSKDGSYTGIITANDGYEIGIGGTFIKASVNDRKIGIGSTNPVYTVDLYGPVSTGTTAAYVFGDVEVTGSIKATSLQGQISAGGTVGFTNVSVENVLEANNAEVYTRFTVQETGSDTFTFVAAGNPPGIGFTQNTDNPEIYLARGQKYLFDLDSGGFPFYIKSQPTADLNNLYGDGVDNNGAQVGIVTFKVPFNSPNILYYQASNVSGMGGTIYITNDYKSIVTGIATIITLDAENGDFEYVNVSGMATLANIRSTDFSVSSGIVTAKKFVGVSTGSDMISVHQKNDSVDYQVLFTESVGVGSYYQLAYVDEDSTHLTYNPSTRTLTSQTFAGIATGADLINIDEKNDNINYQVLFSSSDLSAYQRPYIDSDNSHFTYNPSTQTLTISNLVGNLTGDVSGTVTNANFINIDEKNDNVNYQIIFNDNQGASYQRLYIDSDSGQFVYNPSTRTFNVQNISSTNVTGTTFTGTDFIGQASNATNLNLQARNTTNATHYITFGTSTTGNQRLNTDTSLTYNPGTNTLTTGSFSGNGASVTNIDGGNISTGVINEARLPNASTSAQGVVQLDNTYPPTNSSTTTAPTANVARRLYNESVGVIPSGTTMLFCQASAPTGWTKVTSHNNKALRVVSGTGGGSGGNNTFTSTFDTRTVPLPRHNHDASTGDAGGHSHSGSTNSAGSHSHGASTGGAGSHSHSINDPGHRHTYERERIEDRDRDGGGATADNNTNTTFTSFSTTGISINGVGNHSHSVSINAAGNHSHSLSINAAGDHSHSLLINGVGNHSHSVSVSNVGTSGASMDFRVQYVDVIICSKNSY